MEGWCIYVANKFDQYRQGNKHGSGFKAVTLAELKDVGFWRAVFAEFLSTMLFVFLGCAAASFNNVGDPPAVATKVSLAFGLAIVVLIQAIGHVSGGHINPAVSIAMAVSCTITPVRAICYTIAQCIGGIAGAFLLMGLTPSDIHSNLGVTSLSPQITAAQGFGIELVLTFVLLMTIYGSTDPNRAAAGPPALFIGLAVALLHFSGMLLTGASMNPARSLGSAVASNSWVNHWVYWAGPIIGGIIAALVYKYIINPYRGWLSPDEAMSKMMSDADMVAVPREYFRGGNDGKPKQLVISEHM